MAILYINSDLTYAVRANERRFDYDVVRVVACKSEKHWESIKRFDWQAPAIISCEQKAKIPNQEIIERNLRIRKGKNN